MVLCFKCETDVDEKQVQSDSGLCECMNASERTGSRVLRLLLVTVLVMCCVIVSYRLCCSTLAYKVRKVQRLSFQMYILFVY